MTCPRCHAQCPEVARFCWRCGTALHQDLARDEHFAAQPGEAVRALAIVSTLMPHLSGRRHHLYRLAVAVAVAAALVAAGFGVLPVALICAGIALPGALLTYLYDHEVWAEEPLGLRLAGVLVAAGLGVGIGYLADLFSQSGFVLGLGNPQPAIARLLLECLALPAVAAVALQLVPAALTSRASLRHVLDALTLSALAGTAFALAESIVIQHGAFTSLTAQSTDAARDAFVALTLGFAKPIVYATASALAVMRLRRPRATTTGYLVGLAESFLLVAAYDSGVATLATYGQRGVVLTFLAAAAVGAYGLVRVRTEVHDALLLEGEAAAGLEVGAPPSHGGHCAECGMPVLAGASFCLACGTAVAAMPKPHQRALRARAVASA